MIFTSDELSFMCSIAKCAVPFGIKLNKISKDDAENRATKAIKALEKKNIIAGGKLTETGIIVTRIWEEFSKTQQIVIINHCIIGLLEDRRCAVSVAVDGGYEFASGDTVSVVYSLLKNKQRLCEGTVESKKEYSMKLDYNGLRNRLLKYGENVLSVGIFDFKENTRSERIFYWDEEDIFSFNPELELETIVDALYVRKYLGDGLGLKREVVANG